MLRLGRRYHSIKVKKTFLQPLLKLVAFRTALRFS